MMTKHSAFILCALCVLVLAGCGGDATTKGNAEADPTDFTPTPQAAYNQSPTYSPEELAAAAKEAEAQAAESNEATAQDIASWYKQDCKRIAFKRLDRDADLLIGRQFRITGQVFQIQDAGPGNYWEGYPDGVEPRTSMLVAMTNEGYGVWDDNVAVAYDGRLGKVFEEDIITVWGECLGQYTYESQAGYQITVPALQAEYVTVK